MDSFSFLSIPEDLLLSPEHSFFIHLSFQKLLSLHFILSRISYENSKRKKILRFISQLILIRQETIPWRISIEYTQNSINESFYIKKSYTKVGVFNSELESIEQIVENPLQVENNIRSSLYSTENISDLKTTIIQGVGTKSEILSNILAVSLFGYSDFLRSRLCPYRTFPGSHIQEYLTNHPHFTLDEMIQSEKNRLISCGFVYFIQGPKILVPIRFNQIITNQVKYSLTQNSFILSYIHFGSLDPSVQHDIDIDFYKNIDDSNYIYPETSELDKFYTFHGLKKDLVKAFLSPSISSRKRALSDPSETSSYNSLESSLKSLDLSLEDNSLKSSLKSLDLSLGDNSDDLSSGYDPEYPFFDEYEENLHFSSDVE